jgi:cytosine/adenosine deaminase-related metal-dependent hydrolase
VALGLEGETGSIKVGKWGDCVVLRTPASAAGTPAERALASGREDVIATLVGGKAVYRAESAGS